MSGGSPTCVTKMEEVRFIYFEGHPLICFYILANYYALYVINYTHCVV